MWNFFRNAESSADRSAIFSGTKKYEYNVHILLGSITKHKETFYNSAVLLTIDRKRIYYTKQALSKKEQNELKQGSDLVIFAINGVKIGVRIGEELATPDEIMDYMCGEKKYRIDEGNYNDKEGQWLALVNLETSRLFSKYTVQTLNSLEPTFFDENFGYYEEIVKLMSSFQSGCFNHELARIIRTETDDSILAIALQGVTKIAYDPTFELLESSERSPAKICAAMKVLKYGLLNPKMRQFSRAEQ